MKTLFSLLLGLSALFRASDGEWVDEWVGRVRGFSSMQSIDIRLHARVC